MELQGQSVVVSGGASGLGAETVRHLVNAGARVAILDVNEQAAKQLAEETGGLALACDITDTNSIETALAAAAEANGPARVLVNCAGVAGAMRLVSKDGDLMPLEHFSRIVNINLIGTFNVIRLFTARVVKLEPLESGERGVIINTASVAAFDGQVGQEAYAASKGGVASLTLPLARDLAQFGVRAMTIAPGLFQTPLLKELPAHVQESLAASIPFPKRLGDPGEFAALALHIVSNPSLNGETIRLDGALRLPPR
ncbi:MAG: 3-hydroxyacyl-CoA dehydrogenase [Alcaligenaceae bacterium]|nr:3-hydroxyacyl-CoA dehydrogenase [Alcaligenaceae bacterium]MAO50224.1 3-hydroxyacyl-CoA dehydrogenase [Pusillimonas sp.]MBC42057.1 3-hydroxyacyl-CoA dehydrogenase [Pusillimonas sp.]|tara:strand:- start:3590 stop:4354 length:765 start_codon:yes stop_codon:yes gene_type:complete